MPKFSVIIPTYNRSSFICDAIKSVLNQTFKDFEIIVVDDGSTDKTKEALAKYGSAINYIYQENKGRSEARNTGIRIAQGEYIAFLDDDDIWLPHKLEKQVTFLDSNPDMGLVHTFTDVVDEQNHMLPEATKNRLKLYKKAMKIGYTYTGISQLGIMFLSTAMIRKKCFAKVGLFDPNIFALEDWDFCLRFALEYRIGIIAEPLVRFRLHQKHTTNDEFTQGRIKTAMKHLALLDSCGDASFCNRVRLNLYIHLANAYYIDRQWAIFRTYVPKILKLNPLIFLRSRLGLHFLASLMRKTEASLT